MISLASRGQVTGMPPYTILYKKYKKLPGKHYSKRTLKTRQTGFGTTGDLSHPLPVPANGESLIRT
jgi:hypothetical protein